MNWTRTFLDGLAMAAYFNLFAAAVALYRPRLMFPCYPPAIIKAAKDPPTKAENRFYRLWICFGEWLPLLLNRYTYRYPPEQLSIINASGH